MLRRLALLMPLLPLVATAQTSDRVERLLGQMTLEEKVGQMTQLTLTPLAAGPSNGTGRIVLDAAKLREALVEHHIGSVINVHDDALSVAGWRALTGEIQRVAATETRLGIPVLYGVDDVHGANYTLGGTVFPHGIGMAATFDRALVGDAARATADEVAATGVAWNFAPVLDVGRQPLWPRFYETFGEDPWLAGEMGAEAIRGLQASGRVAATMKHFLGYGGPVSGRDRTPTLLPERLVREQFLAPFAAGVAAGARTVMVNSGEVNGEPVHASRYWLTDVLRGELGFTGVVVSDWEDVTFLHTRHRVAPTLRDAVRMSVEAGLDICMTPYDFAFADLLAGLVRDGTIPEARIDASVRRVLTLKESLGLFDAPAPPDLTPETLAAHRALATRAAAESVTLLANDGTLPLKPGTRVAVVGPAAHSLTALGGGWTYTWQGQDPAPMRPGVPTLLDALRARDLVVEYERGADFEADLSPAQFNAAVRAAAEAEVAIVAVGEAGYAEWVGDLTDLTLPAPQLRLARAVAATGTPTVLVLLEGRPRVLQDVPAQAAAVVMGYWPGLDGADALADILVGVINPSGRLPFTYPRAVNALVAYDHKWTETLGTGYTREQDGFDPLYPFGHGLSYTTFAYSDLRLDRDHARAGDTLTATVTVTNTGSRSGDDAVLLFVRQHVGSLTPHVRRFRGAERVRLDAGAAQTVTFRVPVDALAVIGRNGQPLLEPGLFSVLVGDEEAVVTIEP